MDSIIINYVKQRPASFAKILEKHPDSVIDILNSIPISLVVTILPQLEIAIIGDFFEQLSLDKILVIAENLDVKLLSHTLRKLSEQKREEILSAISLRKKIICQQIFSYNKSLTGAWMFPINFIVTEDNTVDEIIAKIKKYSYRGNVVYVIDGAHSIQGFVFINSLLKTKNIAIKDIMLSGVEAVCAEHPVEVIKNHPGWMLYDCLPVVNSREEFIGIIRSIDIRRAIRFLTEQTVVFDKSSNFTGSLVDIYGKTLTNFFGFISQFR